MAPIRPIVRVHQGRGKGFDQLRVPIRRPNCGVFCVLIYARCSTDDQNLSSIEDQIAHCKRFLESISVTDAHIEVLSDAGISGELVSRPGINQVPAGIEQRRWNLILVEDSSRFFRKETACGRLFETAYDRNIRVGTGFYSRFAETVAEPNEMQTAGQKEPVIASVR